MFETRRAKSPSNAVITMGIVVFHSVVHRIRKSQRSPIMSILTSIMQSVTMVLAFIFMMDILGMRGAAVRGDFVLYVMSGIFLYLTHTQTVGAVSGAETSSSPMMQHAPIEHCCLYFGRRAQHFVSAASFYACYFGRVLCDVQSLYGL